MREGGSGLPLGADWPAGDKPVPLEGNFLLDNLFGASYEIVDAGMGKDLNRRIMEAATRFQSQGRKVFRWDRTVVTPLAAISYVECAAEIVEQSSAEGFVPTPFTFRRPVRREPG